MSVELGTDALIWLGVLFVVCWLLWRELGRKNRSMHDCTKHDVFIREYLRGADAMRKAIIEELSAWVSFDADPVSTVIQDVVPKMLERIRALKVEP